MKEITFKFKDNLCLDENWRTQHCTVNSVDECIRIYGLNDIGVEYEILEVKDVE